MNEDMTINLEGLLASKFPGKKFPTWAINALRRLLRVDFINGYLAQGYKGTEFCTKCIEFLDVKLEVKGIENIPADGTLYTFASNHPLGGIDGVALAGLIGTHFGEATMLVNDFLMAIPGLKPLFVPVNKIGGQARSLPQMVSTAFNSDRQLLIFPAGMCSRKIDGKVQDLEWSKTFISKSISSGRKIVPVHFIAQNSPRFYRIATLCKKLKIKFNIAMTLLPDELYKGQHKTFQVVFGEPIDPSGFDKSATAAQWAAKIRELVYTLE